MTKAMLSKLVGFGLSIVFVVVVAFVGCAAATQQQAPVKTAVAVSADMPLETAPDTTNDVVVDGESADSVPVRTSPLTIIGAHTEEEAQAVIEVAELEALCPRPTRATAGDRDVWVCEP